jgi:DNA-binding response OmpR family regulator
VHAFVSAALGEDGHGIPTATDGEAAVQTARAERPDLIILDVQMPKRAHPTKAILDS